MKTFGKMTREEKIALLTAWVDGREIESYSGSSGVWVFSRNPSWYSDCMYRVKPAAPCAGKTVEIDGVKYKLVEV
jgi:hypothetical protein